MGRKCLVEIEEIRIDINNKKSADMFFVEMNISADFMPTFNESNVRDSIVASDDIYNNCIYFFCNTK